LEIRKVACVRDVVVVVCVGGVVGVAGVVEVVGVVGVVGVGGVAGVRRLLMPFLFTVLTAVIAWLCLYGGAGRRKP